MSLGHSRSAGQLAENQFKIRWALRVVIPCPFLKREIASQLPTASLPTVDSARRVKVMYFLDKRMICSVVLSIAHMCYKKHGIASFIFLCD